MSQTHRAPRRAGRAGRTGRGTLVACLAALGPLAVSAPAAGAGVTVDVEPSLRDQNVRVAGVWIGRHGGAWFGQTRELARRLPGLRCHDDGTTRARLILHGRATFAMAGLGHTASCWDDAVEFTTVKGSSDRVRLGSATIRIGRRTPAVVRRRLTYLRENAATVTYGVSRRADVCHPGRIAPGGGWQVTLTVSKRTHDVTAVRVFSGLVEALCP